MKTTALVWKRFIKLVYKKTWRGQVDISVELVQQIAVYDIWTYFYFILQSSRNELKWWERKKKIKYRNSPFRQVPSLCISLFTLLFWETNNKLLIFTLSLWLVFRYKKESMSSSRMERRRSWNLIPWQKFSEQWCEYDTVYDLPFYWSNLAPIN